MSKINIVDWLQERQENLSNELKNLPAHCWGSGLHKAMAEEEADIFAAQRAFSMFAKDQLQLEGIKEFALESALRDVMEQLNHELMSRTKPGFQCDSFSTQFVDRARNQVGQLIDAVVAK